MGIDDKPSDAAALEAAFGQAMSAYAATPSLPALQHCIDACRRWMPAIDPNTGKHGTAVVQLAEFLGTRWALTRSDTDWAESNALIDAFRAQIPAGDPRDPPYALAQGVLLYRRADATQAPQDIANALYRLQQSRSMVRSGSFVHRFSSLYQGDLRLRRYEAERDPGDLEAAIADAGAVLDARQMPAPHRVAASKTFARAAYLFADVVGDRGFVDRAVDAVRHALALTHDPLEASDLHSVLGSLLRERFARDRQDADIDDAIAAYRAAADQVGLPDAVRASRIDNLGNGLAVRHAARGDSADLDAMLACHRQALQLSRSGSPARASMHGHFAASLLARWRSRHDADALEQAVGTLTAGLLEAAKHESAAAAAMLNGRLLEVLLASHVATGVDAQLDRAIAAGEAALQGGLASEGDDPLIYRLAARERWSPIVRRLVAALVRRVGRGGAGSDADLRRALVIGEAAKVPMLTRELMRRSLPAPAGAAEGDLFFEAQMLAELAAFDVHDMAPADSLSQARRQRRIAQRRNAWGAIERVWEEIAASGAAGAEYVRIRRDLAAALQAALAQRPADWLLMSMLDLEELAPDGRWQQAFCIVALPPGDQAPARLLGRGPNDVVTRAQQQFAAQVLDDPDAEPAAESWWCELGAVLGTQPAPSPAAIMFSPNARGLNLPWALLFERCGWRGLEQTAPPAVIVPSLVLASPADGAGAQGWHELRNSAEHFGIRDDDALAENLRVSLRMPAAPSQPALVVGNPTADLTDADNEAVQVAKALGVQPLLGPAASMVAVRDGFHAARIVHIAAHASFDANDPLASVLRLADGELAARDLIGSWSTSELVVLSACESGTGAPILGGEAVGLAIELLRSGVQGVMASLWPVDDEATSFLMQRFYLGRALGRTKASALAWAMQDTQRQPGWSAPYYWAGFVLVQRGFGE
jgi:CHAT domain